jgi:hypothetical protein
MTNLEALQAICPIAVSSNLYDKVLLDNSISPTDNYTAATDKKIMDLSLADLLEYVINNPDYSEGDVSEKISREALEATVKRIRRKYGIFGGSVRAVSKW